MNSQRNASALERRLEHAWPSDSPSTAAALHAWLDAHPTSSRRATTTPGTLDEHIAQMQRVKAILYDAGWMRCGWPEAVGGLGGSPMLRTELGAALAERDIADPGLFSLIEVLAPTVIDFAPPELAAEMVPRLLSGAEMWCQGFSEPGTGSDLAVAAVPRESRRRPADRVDRGSINGQKVWTSLAQYSDRCVLLTRTGPPESRHRGITAFFVDMDTPGITVAPIEMINGEHEFAEVFFDDVVVPADRMLGEVNGGWAVAMSILPYERSSCFWQRIAYLYRRLQRLVDVVARRRPHRRGRRQRVPAAAHGAGPVARDAAPARRRRDARRGDVDRQGAGRDGRAGDCTTRSAGCCPVWSRSTTASTARCGAASTSTPAPRRSTAAPPRCSATSSPAGCSTSASDE